MDPTPYYEAGLRALRWLEKRSPTRRRFGADADAQWRSFQGHLTAADRLDLLLRDADAEHPGAFAARTAFGEDAVSEDDPFGARWQRLAPAEADALWRRVLADADPTDVPSVVQACAAAWGITLRPVDLPRIEPTTRVLAAGLSAIASLAAAFARGADLAWSDQVTCVATAGAHRHLANLCAALVGSPKPTRLLLGTKAAPSAYDRIVVSDDADHTERDAARDAGGA